MKRYVIALLGAGGLVFGLGVTAASASPRITPQVVVGTSTQENMAGYQVYGNGSQVYNEVRGTVTLPPNENGTVSGPPVCDVATSTLNCVADGILLQQDPNGGWSNVLGFVYDFTPSTGTPVCASDQWTLVAGFGNGPAPGPASALAVLKELTNESAVPAGQVCLNDSQSAYLEIHYSTHLGEIAFLEGPNEFGNVEDLYDLNGVHIDGFEDPAIGTFVNNAEDLTLGSLQSSWARDGLTQPAGYNSKYGPAGERIPFAYPSTQLVESTADGGAPTLSNPVTLIPSAFGKGASFSTSVPSS